LRQNKSHSVTAEVEIPETGAEGVIISQGANIGGWSLYAKNGKLKYCYNVAGVHHFHVEATRVLLAGEHQVRMEFAHAGGGLVVFPIALVYTAAAFWVFRGKVGKLAPRYG